MKSGLAEFYSKDFSLGVLNAIEPGSLLPIHRHRNTSETVCCVWRRVVEEFHDELERRCADAIESLWPC